jgi:hypothetical protein
LLEDKAREFNSIVSFHPNIDNKYLFTEEDNEDKRVVWKMVEEDDD